MAVIELQEDDPDAIETILHYLYNFPHPRSASNGPKFHMDVFITAKKYVLEDLPPTALSGLLNSVSAIEAGYRTSRDINSIFELYQLLSCRRDEQEFSRIIADLTKKYLGELFGIAEFREMLEEDGNQEVLGEVVRMVRATHARIPRANQGEGERQFAMCNHCGGLGATSGLFGFRCPRCHMGLTEGGSLSVWRPA